MKLTLDLDNEKVITDAGVLESPGLAGKKDEIFKLIGLEEIDMAEIRDEINKTFGYLGIKAEDN